MPVLINGKTSWALPDIFPTNPGQKGVIFLDELPQGEPDVQKFLAKLVLDRRVGEYQIPDEVYIVAAGNRARDRAGVGKVLTHLLNRFVHVDFDIDIEDWARWAVDNDIDEDVRGFIRWKGVGYLFDFDPASGEYAFATPRSWNMASDILKTCPDDLLLEALSGTISKGKAAEFVAYRKMRSQLPDPDSILRSPGTAPVPKKEPSVLYSLIAALSSRVRKDPSLAKAYAAYAKRLPDEFSVVAAKELPANVMRQIVADRDGQAWVADLTKKGFLGAGAR